MKNARPEQRPRRSPHPAAPNQGSTRSCDPAVERDEIREASQAGTFRRSNFIRRAASSLFGRTRKEGDRGAMRARRRRPRSPGPARATIAERCSRRCADSDFIVGIVKIAGSRTARRACPRACSTWKAAKRCGSGRSSKPARGLADEPRREVGGSTHLVAHARGRRAMSRTEPSRAGRTVAPHFRSRRSGAASASEATSDSE